MSTPKSVRDIKLGVTRFGKWLVIVRLARRHGRRYFLCKCECGATSEVAGAALLTKRSTRCRHCSRREVGERAYKNDQLSKAASEVKRWAKKLEGEKLRGPNRYKDYERKTTPDVVALIKLK